MPGGQETKSVRQIAEQVSVLFLLKLEISVIEEWATERKLGQLVCSEGDDV